jgi:hypothetical protein
MTRPTSDQRLSVTMTLNSPFLIQRLQELQQNIADAPRCVESLREALARQELGAVVRARMDAERHLRHLETIAGQIKAQVVPADDLGEALESLSELALRAVRMVLLAELNTLRKVVSEPAARGRSRALFQGAFRCVDDLASALCDELLRVTDEWRAYRGVRGVDRATFRAALRNAHASMRELGTTSEVARFLREGFIRKDWPELSDVCARMLAALMIRIDIDPDLPLLVRCSPLPEVAAERVP